MNKKILAIVLCIIMLTSSLTFSQEIGSEVVDPSASDNVELPFEEDLGIPKSFMAESKGDHFELSWRNDSMPDLNNPSDKIMIQVDYREEEWLSEKSSISDFNLPKFEVAWDNKNTIDFNPKTVGVPFDVIDLDNNSYSLRIRYVYIYYDANRVEKHVYGNYSSIINLGLQPYYYGASDWAKIELDKAVGYGIITESIRQNMNTNMTREEFSEVVVKLYEKSTEKPISYSKNPFTDTENPDVLKAASIGIVFGIGEGMFDPKGLVTREAMAVIITRTLELLDVSLDCNSSQIKVFPDNNNISTWAIKGVQFLSNCEIIKGDDFGNLNPLANTTREQAVAIVVRSYEMFN